MSEKQVRNWQENHSRPRERESPSSCVCVYYKGGRKVGEVSRVGMYVHESIREKVPYVHVSEG